MKLKKRLAALGVILAPLFWGCGPPQPPAWFGQETAAAAMTFVEQVGEQGVWDRLMARLRGHVNQPGLVGMVRTTVEIGGRVIGADGDVWLEGDGFGREARSDPVRTQILEMWKNSEITDDQAMDWLGRPRVSPPVPVTPAPPTMPLPGPGDPTGARPPLGPGPAP